MDKSKRLQGDEFKLMRSKLTMFGYEVTEKGSIKALLEGIEQNKKKYYHHWLSNEEINRFMKSSFFKYIDPFDGKKEWVKEKPIPKKKSTTNNTKNDKAKAFELLVKYDDENSKFLAMVKSYSDYCLSTPISVRMPKKDFTFLHKIVLKEMENQNEKAK